MEIKSGWQRKEHAVLKLFPDDLC